MQVGLSRNTYHMTMGDTETADNDSRYVQVIFFLNDG